MSDTERQLSDIQRQMAHLEEQITMLLKMNKSILQSKQLWGHSGHYHVAGGFCWGNTGDGAPFLVLYPKSDKLKEKICRVYVDDYQFREIPEWIRGTQENTGMDTTKDKEWAIKRGIYRECPAMGILTSDGKETQMGHEKRFAGVLWVYGQRRVSQPTSTPDPAPAPPSTNGTSPAPTPPASDAPTGHCPSCHAPAGKPHATTCKAVGPDPDKPQPAQEPPAPPTGPNAEFDRLPGHGKNGHVPTVTEHQLQRIRAVVVQAYGPTWAEDDNEKKLAEWASDNTAQTFATLSKDEATKLLDALLRRVETAKQKKAA